MPNYIVACITVKRLPDDLVIPGSKIVMCDTCSEEVWFSPDSIELHGLPPKEKVMCMDCLLRTLKGGTEDEARSGPVHN